MLVGPIGLSAVMIGLIAVLVYRDRGSTVNLQRGRESAIALEAVETFPDQGRNHIEPGETVDYASEFPTSGPHDPTPVAPSFYSQVQKPEQLVHSLEHGNIVIYYDRPSDSTIKTLKEWSTKFSGSWDGVVVTPKPGLGEEVVLTAWTKQLALSPFDAEAAFRFIDGYRGRGPENPVR